jgi:integrase/recombinase XerD
MSAEMCCLPIVAWPERDRLAWQAGTRRADLFEQKSAGADWSAHSRAKTARGYGRWLCWLRQKGLFDPTLTPGARVTRQLVADYVATLSASRAPYTVVCRLQELYDALRVLAPEMEWRWLAELWMRLGRRAEPVANKRLRLRPTRDLLDLGRRMMISAERETGWSKQLCLDHRWCTSCAAERRMVAPVPATEMKAKRPYEVVFPTALIPELKQYLAIHRTVLLAGEKNRLSHDTNALWVSEIGTMLETGALASRIRKHTKEVFGASLPPHWFRDAAATSIAVEDPRHVCDAHHILGNTLATTEKHYNQARSLEASRRH